jgi:hypothetical protein
MWYEERPPLQIIKITRRISSEKILYNPVTLADIGISEQRKELVIQAIAEVWTTGICNSGENGQSLHDILFAYLSQTPEGIKLRQQGEKQQALEHARERLERAVKGLKDKNSFGK